MSGNCCNSVVNGVEFSQFNPGGAPVAGDILVGLRNNINTQFTFAGSSNANALVTQINQPLHGFSVGQIVKYNGTQYVLAQADSSSDAEVIGVVSSIIDSNNFDLLTSGYITTLSALSPGVVYFLSDTTAGLLTTIEPTTPNHISKPLLIAVNNTSGYFYNWRGKIVPNSATNNITYVTNTDATAFFPNSQPLAPLASGVAFVTTTTGLISTIPMTSNGQLLIGSATGPAAATLTAGSGISITNGPSSISIAISGASTSSFHGDTGTATPAAGVITISGGTTGLTTTASGSTVSLTGTLGVANGGTGDTSFTTYAPICGGTSTTGALQSASSGISNVGYVLTSTGAASLPTWQATSVAPGNNIIYAVHQVAHGFSVGNFLYFNGTSYVKALADTAADAEVAGIVSVVSGPDDFTLLMAGQITTLSGLTAGTVYFLDDVTAGNYVAVPPSTVGHINKPLMIATSTTSAVVVNFRGEVIPSTGPLGPGGGGSGTSTTFTQGSVVFAGVSGVYSQDNANFFWDGTNHYLGIGTSTPAYQIHEVQGAADTFYIDGATTQKTSPVALLTGYLKANTTGTKGEYLNVNANGNGDTHGLNIDFAAGNLPAASECHVFEANVDMSSSNANSTVAAMAVFQAQSGSGNLYGYQANPGVYVIRQNSGTYISTDHSWYFNGSTYTAIQSGTHTIFSNNADIVYVGALAVFNQANFVLSTVATGRGINPKFEYWNGAAWTSFTPSDGTSGFRNSGVIQWPAGSLSGWATTAVNGQTDFYIRITRQNGATITAPVETSVTTAATTAYGWDASANLTVNTITANSVITPFSAITTNTTLVNNTTYYCSSGGTLTLTLPTTSAAGTVIEVLGGGATGWSIIYGTGQSIQIGTATSTVTSGSVSSTNAADRVKLICVVANTTWRDSGYDGFLTVV